MKKLQMVLLASLIIGVASAFTTTSKMSLNSVYAYDGSWHELDPARIGDQFDCIEGSSYCLYQDASFDNPLPGQTQTKTFVFYGN